MQFFYTACKNNIHSTIIIVMLFVVASPFSSSIRAVAAATASATTKSRSTAAAAAGHYNNHRFDVGTTMTFASGVRSRRSSSSSIYRPSRCTRLFHSDYSRSSNIIGTEEDIMDHYVPSTSITITTIDRKYGDGGSVEEDCSTNNIRLDHLDAVEDLGKNTGHDHDDDATTTTTSSSLQTWQNPRSRWAKRKHRKKMEKQLREGIVGDGDSGAASVLDWETFEFGTSPKTDKRFEDNDISTNPTNQTGIPNHVLNTIATNTITYQTYLQHEANIDKSTAAESIRSKSELLSLSPQIVEKSIRILSPYILPRRMQRIESILSQRTRHARFLFENPSNPSNVWACLRTLDSFGIQYVDVIMNSDSYQGKAAVIQKRGMRTAMGSAVWMTIRQFGSIEEAITCLRQEEGCLIYASDLNPNAKDVRDLIWDVDFDDVVDSNVENNNNMEDEINNDTTENRRSNNGDGKIMRRRQDQRPICIVMGNEERGISDEMRSVADETFYLPMCGFAESFNLSVATAITLAYMSAASDRGVAGDRGSRAGTTGSGSGIKGPLRPGDLDPHELQCLKLRGVINSLAQKRMGKALLKQEGIVLPNSLFL